ncbi:MAG TPA: hypothetical protein VHJ58_12155, partial [Vicinamibacterales bacterium]|nr:hypothetical protein [Vicinamibacterales bacterium]
MRKKRTRGNGSGTVYKNGNIWYFAYKGPDGKRIYESSRSKQKGDAEHLLRKRLGALAENRPVVPRAEQVTFEQGVQAVVNNFKLKGRKSLDELERRIRLHLL